MPDGLIGRTRFGILLTTDAVGGVWRYTLDLARAMVERGSTVTVAVLGPPPSHAQRLEAAETGAALVDTGLPLDWMAAAPADIHAAADGICRLAARLSAASVHLHTPSLAVTRTASWPAPVVAVAHSCLATWWRAVRRGPMPDDFLWRTAMARDGFGRAGRVIAPTHTHAAALREIYGELPLTVVHNGAAPAPAPSGPRARAVLTAGRLWDDGKDAAALDRVAPRVGAPIRAAGPTIGPNGAGVVLPNLHLLGTLDPAGMRAAYAAASVFASAARYEPFGLSVLEAAQAGMRLVLADTPGFRELWDGAARFVRTDAELHDALAAALDAPGDGGSRARAARYTIAATADATLAVHRALGVPV